MFSQVNVRDAVNHQRVSLAEVSKGELAEIEAKILKKYSDPSAPDIPDDQLAKLIEKEHGGPKSRAYYKVQATRGMVGGKRVNDNMLLGALANLSVCSVVPVDGVDLKADDVYIEFFASTYAVIESVGTMQLTVCRSGDKNIPCAVDYKTRDGSAKAKSDYIHVEGTVQFEKGE